MKRPFNQKVIQEAKVQPADEFVPDYLRKSQAERQREAEASPDGQAGKLPGDY